MFKSFVLLAMISTTATCALAHGPQLVLTNDGGKIVTRQISLEEPYNTAPNPPTPATNVFVIPTTGISTFGGTGWFTKPSDAANNGPGLAWCYGWTYTDSSTYTTTFPLGANFVQTVIGNLQKFDGADFVTAPGGAQMQILRSGTNMGVSGTGDSSIEYKAIAAPTSAAFDDHQGATFQLLGNGVVSSTGNPPALLPDGVYLAEMKLSLANQPVGPQIADSDSFYFVMYKGVSQASALEAAQLEFPSASIQVVPEPAAVMGVVVFAGMMLRRPSRRAA